MKKIIVSFLIAISVISAISAEDLPSNYYPPLFTNESPPPMKNRFEIMKRGYYYYIYDKAKHEKILTQSCRFITKTFKEWKEQHPSDIIDLDDMVISDKEGAELKVCQFLIDKANKTAETGEDIFFSKDTGNMFYQFRLDMSKKVVNEIQSVKDKKWHLIAIPFDLFLFKSSEMIKIAYIWGFKNGKWVYYTNNTDEYICHNSKNIICSKYIKAGGAWFKKKEIK